MSPTSCQTAPPRDMRKYIINYMPLIRHNIPMESRREIHSSNGKSILHLAIWINSRLKCLAASYSCGGKASTTIGAEELNYCVRDGNRCELFAIATKPSRRSEERRVGKESRAG